MLHSNNCFFEMFHTNGSFCVAKTGSRKRYKNLVNCFFFTRIWSSLIQNVQIVSSVVMYLILETYIVPYIVCRGKAIIIRQNVRQIICSHKMAKNHKTRHINSFFRAIFVIQGHKNLQNVPIQYIFIYHILKTKFLSVRIDREIVFSFCFICLQPTYRQRYVKIPKSSK